MRTIQTFEIDLRGKEGVYSYTVEIEHEIDRGRCRVKAERLLHNKKLLYASDTGDAQLYHDDGAPGPKVLSDWNRSGVGRLQPRHDNKLLTAFKRNLENVLVMQIHPDKMLAKSGKETAHPNKDMSDFVAWYRHLSQDQQSRVSDLRKVLGSEVLEGFRELRLKSVGAKSRALWAEFGIQVSDKEPETVTEYRFGELSDGQRALIALYALATCISTKETPSASITLKAILRCLRFSLGSCGLPTRPRKGGVKRSSLRITPS